MGIRAGPSGDEVLVFILVHEGVEDRQVIQLHLEEPGRPHRVFVHEARVIDQLFIDRDDLAIDL